MLPSLLPLFDNPKLDRELRGMIKDTFSEFCESQEGVVFASYHYLHERLLQRVRTIII